MFTGIIETTAEIKNIQKRKENSLFTMASDISASLKIDQSVSHNGACLTVVNVEGDTHQVEAIDETLKKTNLGNWKKGDSINLERALLLNERLDGHLVQGHVDTKANCFQREEQEGSVLFSFRFPEKFADHIIEKGSITVNGISLTAFDVEKTQFSVAVIPYTFQHTNMSSLTEGASVNLEFDLIGKYILRSEKLQKQQYYTD